MHKVDEGNPSVGTSRILKLDGTIVEREQLFRNMAQLFSYVSERADDDQIAQYDEVLCQLADLVDAEAREHVAKLLAPLKRAPHRVVLKLAHDQIEVARPLLAFSSLLSDDDLIEIIMTQSEEHREVIAGRLNVSERVGDAVVNFGRMPSIQQLVRNTSAVFGRTSVATLKARAAEDAMLAAELRNRGDIDWTGLDLTIERAAGDVLQTLGRLDEHVHRAALARVKSVVYNRMRNRAGFSSQEWKQAYNQVKALDDRNGLDEAALVRFARFGYGHHLAAGLSILLRVQPEVFVKWLAMQDYVALTVGMRALALPTHLFERTIACLPWRDMPSDADKANVGSRFDAIEVADAREIFETWRGQNFRRRSDLDAPGGRMH